MTESTLKFMNQLYNLGEISSSWLAKLHSAVSLLARLYIAKIFFFAGLTKIQDWETTLFLFEEEYAVPLLSPELAAFLGTFGELVFPILLVAGLFTRYSAIALSIVNIVAVISLEDIAPAALYLHVIWGVLLAQLVVYGGGRLSLDTLIKRKFG